MAGYTTSNDMRLPKWFPAMVLINLSWSTYACKVVGHHSSGGEVKGVNGPAIEPKPLTYALMQSFSYCLAY